MPGEWFPKRPLTMYADITEMHWANPDYMYDSVVKTLPEYEDIFRTKGEMKKALRNIEEVRAQTWNELEKESPL